MGEAQAVKARPITLHGPSTLCMLFRSWLGPSHSVMSLFHICSLLKVKAFVGRWLPIAGMFSLLASMVLMLRGWRSGTVKRNTHDDLERQEVLQECAPVDPGDHNRPLLPSGS